MEDRTSIDLSYFHSLTTFESESCKPNMIVDLPELRTKLLRIYMSDCLNSLSELLDFEIDNTQLVRSARKCHTPCSSDG